MGRALYNMKDIQTAYNYSECTILKRIREMNFPAVKIGGNWTSHTDLIDEWIIEQVRNRKRAEKKRGRW